MKRTVGLVTTVATGAILFASAPAAFANPLLPRPPHHQAAGAAQPGPAGAVHPVSDVRVVARDARQAARQAINDAFKAAIDAATAQFDASMASAKTAGAKAAAMAARRAATVAAIAARQQALAAIPPPPRAPKITKAPKAP